MFNDKLASFHAFPSMDETCLLGELAFTDIQLPFKKLDMTSTKFKQIDIHVGYDFLLPFEHGQFVVTFNRYKTSEDSEEDMTLMSCFDPLGRLTGSKYLFHHVEHEHVGQCGPSEFIVCHYSDSPELSVYDSDLKCLRNVGCRDFSSFCCNSQFVFGLWNTGDSCLADSDDDDKQEEEYSSHRIQARHLDTLSKAFSLRVPKKYTIERIMADERHVVAMSFLKDSKLSSEWFMSIFDLATYSESDFFLAERHVGLAIESYSLPRVFLFDGWLVVPRENQNELVWFDKRGARSETSTKWDSDDLNNICSSGSSLFFIQRDGNLLLKR